MTRFKLLSLQKKFNLMMISLLTICISLGFLVDTTVKRLLFENTKSYTQNISSKFEGEMNYLLDRVNTIYEYLQFDQNLEKVLISPFVVNSTIYINELQRTLLFLSILNTDIVDIALVNDEIAWSNLFNAKDLQAMSNKLDGTSSLVGLNIMSSSFVDSELRQYLVFGKNIFGFQSIDYYSQPLGSVILSIDPSKLSLNLATSNKIDTYFMLCDKNLSLYPFNCDLELAEYIISTFQGSYDFTTTNTNSTIELDTPEYVIYLSYIPSVEYYLISAVDKDQLYSNLSSTRLLIILIIFIVVVFMLILIRILLTSVVRPINKLYLFIKSIRAGNMKQLKNSVTLDGSIEIVTLSDEFNRMLTEITSLNRQLFETTTHLYELELEKNKAEIAHLRSQINPHFLYNTLESIRGIALEHNVPEIATISVAMGKMFRYSIKGSPTAPLSEELSIIKAYLDIQLIRFNNKFDIFYHIDTSSENLLVPKMIIQPLVENAIFHGLEKKVDSGILYIGSKIVSNTELHVIVQDDGIGIESDFLHMILTQLSNNEPTSQLNQSHIGILNVHNRIRLAYGSPYGLRIESKQNLGTKITLILPNLSQEKENLHV